MGTKKSVACGRALNALRGRLTPIPPELTAADVLREFGEVGGLYFSDSPEAIVTQAVQNCGPGTRISHLVVNKVYGETHIVLLLDIPGEQDLTEDTILGDKGVLSYVYNVESEWCSEMGRTFFERRADGAIYRVG